MGRGGYNGGSTVIHGGSGWFGRGSVTSQPASKTKKPTAPAKPRRKKKTGKVSTATPKKGNGLTIPEKVAKAEQKVLAIRNQINDAKRQLGDLERKLGKALADVETARNLPRKTALGAALHQAEAKKVENKDVKVKAGSQSNAERKAEREARQRYRNSPKEVSVEVRVAGKIVGKRMIERS